MRNVLANLISPHYCCYCGTIGAILCQNCKYDIISERYAQCVICLSATPDGNCLCMTCIMPYLRAWCAGERQGALHELLEKYKFERAKSSYKVLAELLDESIPILPEDTVIVPVPTIRDHIRKRGYDHVALIAREFAKRRKLPYQPLVKRVGNTVQLGASRRLRQEQAAKSYTAVDNALPLVLLIDDVLTTGSTAHFAAKALRDAGTEMVYFAVLARQPLEKSEKY